MIGLFVLAGVAPFPGAWIETSFLRIYREKNYRRALPGRVD